MTDTKYHVHIRRPLASSFQGNLRLPYQLCILPTLLRASRLLYPLGILQIMPIAVALHPVHSASYVALHHCPHCSHRARVGKTTAKRLEEDWGWQELWSVSLAAQPVLASAVSPVQPQRVCCPPHVTNVPRLIIIAHNNVLAVPPDY